MRKFDKFVQHSPMAASAALLRPRHSSLSSMPKDAALESALSRNRRWIVNNQIKNLLLRSPSRTATVRYLQSHFKTLDLQGRALNWLRKYPVCFDIIPSTPNAELRFRLSNRMLALVDEENSILASSEPVMARRLAKLLALSHGRRLKVAKVNELKRSLGLPDDYLFRIIPHRSDMFRIINHPDRRGSTELELLCDINKFDYYNADELESEKRAVAVVCELLSLTLWKKASIMKLEHFRKEFDLPERLGQLLLRHPGIFYVSNRYKIDTVVLRDGYRGSELVDKDPLVVVKEKFGELMQEGLHECNRRKQLVDLEKKRKRGGIVVWKKREEVEDEEAAELDRTSKREERKRFYRALFDDKP